MIDIDDQLLKDMEAVKQIPIVPTMLEVICQITGMGFAAIARVTEDRWLACSVRDEVQLGLKEGDELKIETTFCREIRNTHQPIIIDHVDEDLNYKNHPIPKMHGLQSYVSFPIILKDGTFFGTLCTISSKPAKLNHPQVFGTFTMFAELLAFHLQSLDLMERSYQANIELHQKNTFLTKVNNDLDTIVYTASHDLKSPVFNIEGLVDVLSRMITQKDLDREEIQQILGLIKSNVKRFAGTINDLTTIIEADGKNNEAQSERINFLEMVEGVKQDLHHLIVESDASLQVISEDNLLLNIGKKNLKSILYNLLSNALKYRSSDRKPEVLVKLKQVDGKIHLSVTDNGLGIPAEQQDKVFTLFKRFHSHVEGSGLGLFLVKRIIDNVNGHIQINSILNKGTTFTIII